MQVVVLFVVGIVALIGSVFLYTSQESNDFKKFTEAVKDAKSSYESSEKKFGEYDTKLSQALEACQKTTGLVENVKNEQDRTIRQHDEWLKKLKADFEIVEVRQRTMEKKQLQSKRELMMNFGTPLPVQIIRQPASSTKPSTTPLLDKVGITGQKKAQPAKAN